MLIGMGNSFETINVLKRINVASFCSTIFIANLRIARNNIEQNDMVFFLLDLLL